MKITNSAGLSGATPIQLFTIPLSMSVWVVASVTPGPDEQTIRQVTLDVLKDFRETSADVLPEHRVKLYEQVRQDLVQRGYGEPDRELLERIVNECIVFELFMKRAREHRNRFKPKQ